MESFADLFEESLATTRMKQGSIVTGTVVDIQSDLVIINAGLKSEAEISIKEFLNADGESQVEIGDQVDVSLESVEDGYGATILSRENAKRIESWKYLERMEESGDTISGIFSGKVRGGFTVEIDGVRAFLPGSLVDVRPIRDTSYLEGKKVEVKVIKLDEKRNNVVVSRRAVLEAEFSAEREEALKNMEDGQVVKGVVKNLTDYGAFLDLGGIDGLLHITDMAWKRVRHPSDIVNIGDEVDVQILKFDKDKNRVSLGLKQMGEDPWADITRRYPKSSRVFGKITNITDYGAFVEIEDGVEGLVHTSEMDWTNKNIHPSKVVQPTEEVEVMILEIDEERRRISLGMKQCKENPWEVFASTHSKGEHVKGNIKSITDFGIFIGLDGNIDGLVHMSDISWQESGEEAVQKHKKGDELEAKILAIDPERERISLGLKQLDQDPFSLYLAEHPKGSIVNGTVAEVDSKGAKVNLNDEVTGYIHVAEISEERTEDARTVLKEGEEVEVAIIGMDRKARSISLSIKAKDSIEEKAAIKAYSSDTADNPGSTFGDVLQGQIGESSDD